MWLHLFWFNTCVVYLDLFWFTCCSLFFVCSVVCLFGVLLLLLLFVCVCCVAYMLLFWCCVCLLYIDNCCCMCGCFQCVRSATCVLMLFLTFVLLLLCAEHLLLNISRSVCLLNCVFAIVHRLIAYIWCWFT